MRLLVVCNGGMSSSIIVKKLKEAAESKQIELVTEANATNELGDQVGKWDVCLVAPQIMYAVDNVKKTLNIPVAAIDYRVYAIADGEKALDQALELLKDS